MSESQLRVIVLGPAGDAQQQLRYALDELGAQTLAVGDFNQLDPAKMRELNPDVWLVSIDENTDPASLEPWQPLFDNPEDTVVFDDADVTRRLSGWDLARWARHLAAKVLGRDDVLLPPVSPDAERLPQPGESVEPARGDEAADADPPPSSGGGSSGPFELSLADDAGHAVPPASAGTAARTNLESFDTGGLSLMDDADVPATVGAATTASIETRQNAEFEKLDLGGLTLVDDVESTLPDSESKPTSVDINSAPFETTDTGGLSLADDADLAALSASFEAGRMASSQREAEPAQSLDDLLRAQQPDADAPVAAVDTDASTAMSARAESPKTAVDLSGLSLMGMDAEPSAPAAKPAAAKPAFNIDIGDLSLTPMDEAEAPKPATKPAPKAVSLPDTLSGLSLAPMDEADSSEGASNTTGSVKTQELPVVRSAKGLIAVIAGLGGPDAVRQFLGALPEDLPVPVLLWQHLDAGKHDRLAQQLEKASKLPVYLARAGESAHPGEVGVVSNGLQVSKEDVLRFAPGNGGASQGLAASFNDPATVIVVLSGAEAAIVEPAKAHAANGGKVLVQTPMTCFDATAASALDGAGAIVALPADLAAHASARWA